VVVIVFGQVHEDPIREEFKKQLPVDDRICWWSCKSIMDVFDAIPARSRSVSGKYWLLGFGDHGKQDSLELPLFQ